MKKLIALMIIAAPIAAFAQGTKPAGGPHVAAKIPAAPAPASHGGGPGGGGNPTCCAFYGNVHFGK
jgi:hypothetical protein